MDLTIKDVATLLNLSNNTIEDWISKGSIPFYKIEDEYRFSRIEIEDWFLKKQAGQVAFNVDQEIGTHGSGSQQFSLYRAIHKGGVLHQVNGKTKQEVIKNAMKTIAKDFHLDPEVLTELLIDRENLQPTALGHGIGIPHTRETFINSVHDRVVVAFPETPIEDYGALDGEPVHTLFFLFACDDKRHLHLLAKIAHLSNMPITRELLAKKPNKITFMEYIRKWESNVGKVHGKQKN